MAQGKDRLYEAEVHANFRARLQKSLQKLDELLSETEKYVVDDVKLLEPKERLNNYTKLLKLAIMLASNDGKGKNAKGNEIFDMKRMSIFGNVFSASKAEA